MSHEFTIEHCITWKNNPLVNPITNKRIKKGSKTYIKIEKECEKLEMLTKKPETKPEIFHTERKIIMWCSLSYKTKDEEIKKIIQPLNNSCPVLLERETKIKWDNSSRWECGECDSKNDDIFGKIVDIFCGIRELILTNWRSIPHYSMPAVQFNNKLIEKHYINSPSTVFLKPGSLTSFLDDMNVAYTIEINKPYKKATYELISLSDMSWKERKIEIKYFTHLSLYNYSSSHDFISIFVPDITEEMWNNLISTINRLRYPSHSSDSKIKVTSELSKFTRSNVEYFRLEAFEIMKCIYKIHLQPKPEYQYWVFYRLLSLLNNNTDCDAMKINILYDRVYDSNKLPVIVIYSMLGKNNFDRLLKAIISHFSGVDHDLVGLNITPRYNTRVSSLIYFSQGNGDDKEYLKALGVLDKYYNKDLNYSIGNVM